MTSATAPAAQATQSNGSANAAATTPAAETAQPPSTSSELGAAPEQPAATPEPTAAAQEPAAEQPETSLLGGEGDSGITEATATDAQGKPETGPGADLQLKLPPGVTESDPLIKAFRPLAAELGLDSAKAQKVVDMWEKASKEQFIQAKIQWQKTQEEWVSKARQDPAIGGENYKKAVLAGRQAISRYGDTEFRQLINQTGFGNHPAFIRVFSRIGLELAKADTIQGATAGSPPSRPMTPAEVFYPNMNRRR